MQKCFDSSFSIMLRRLFDCQNFIVLLNFFFNVWEILQICWSFFYMHYRFRKSVWLPFQLRRVLQETVVDGQLVYMPLSHSMVPTEILWLGKWLVINCFYVGNKLQQWRIFSFLVYFTWIGWTNAAKLISVPRSEIAKSVACYLLIIWFCFSRI